MLVRDGKYASEFFSVMTSANDMQFFPTLRQHQHWNTVSWWVSRGWMKKIMELFLHYADNIVNDWISVRERSLVESERLHLMQTEKDQMK